MKPVDKARQFYVAQFKHRKSPLLDHKQPLVDRSLYGVQQPAPQPLPQAQRPHRHVPPRREPRARSADRPAPPGGHPGGFVVRDAPLHRGDDIPRTPRGTTVPHRGCARGGAILRSFLRRPVRVKRTSRGVPRREGPPGGGAHRVSGSRRHCQRHRGADHFLTVGRTSWDFMRNDGPHMPPDFGVNELFQRQANRLFLQPEVRNMTVLTVERPLGSAGENMFGVPYVSYFHPHSVAEVDSWRAMVVHSKRTHLFAFVGRPRKTVGMAAVRVGILRQCRASPNCRRLECEKSSSLCYQPSKVMEVMLSSEFFMQPPGDSFTRRSVFDSLLGGCVPVFFSEHTAYTQYPWYLPPDPTEYSLMVPEEKWGNAEAELVKVPKERVEAMRRRVVGMIPSLTYVHPNASDPRLHDVVDEALWRLTAHVREKASSMR